MKKCLSGNGLKVIAIGAMTIDHIGYAIVWPLYLAACTVGGVHMMGASRPPEAMRLYALYTFCRCIGRLAIPIFAYMLVEGFRHTRNVRGYALRLGLFALISEIPYDLMFTGQVFYAYEQNIFWSLLLGLLVLIAQEKWVYAGASGRWWKAALIWAAVMAASGVALLVSALALYREKRSWAVVGILAAVARISIMGLGWIQWLCLAAFPIMALYNGERGRGNKYFFYTYYPAHLLVLELIGRMI